ncbi:hypothetical protein OSCI_3560012 [Kamptonema sp. PCC 6506]|nr:hypothetical protein OSCI_3560012 [Kamptonema sp. PCC 6506]
MFKGKISLFNRENAENMTFLLLTASQTQQFPILIFLNEERYSRRQEVELREDREHGEGSN